MINKLTADANESSTHCFKGAHVAALVFFFSFFCSLITAIIMYLLHLLCNKYNQIMEMIYPSEWIANCGGVLSLVGGSKPKALCQSSVTSQLVLYINWQITCDNMLTH